jgi:hypothetical protein
MQKILYVDMDNVLAEKSCQAQAELGEFFL